LNKRCIGNTVPLPGSIANMPPEAKPKPAKVRLMNVV
jgi:hypothetical protein